MSDAALCRAAEPLIHLSGVIHPFANITLVPPHHHHHHPSLLNLVTYQTSIHH